MLGLWKPPGLPQVSLKNCFLPSFLRDRTTPNFSYISIQFRDPDGELLLPLRAKYSYFPRFIGLWLFFVVFLTGSAFPVYFAEASMISVFTSLWKNHAPVVEKVEPQNSQNIAFLEAVPNLDPNKAVGGGDINMSDTAFSPEISPAGQTIAEIESFGRHGKVSLYVVRKGDTLPQIAKMFDVTVNTIMWANDLGRKDTLRTGQTLVILPVDGIQHTVQKGETLRGIVKKYKGDIDEVIDFNNLNKDDALLIGDIIVVPGGVDVTIETPTSVQKGTTKSTRSRTITKYPTYEGYYTHPFPTMVRKSQKIHGFNGVDLAGPIGEAILAAAGGVVVIARSEGWNGGYGKYVVIEHPNGTQTLYGHMSAVYVEAGMSVRSGQQIGENGNTGRSTGPHLHFEVRGAKNPF